MKAFTATWMNLETIILSEVSQTQKDKYHITYMWNLQHNTNEHIYETEMGVAKGEEGGEGWTGNLGLADANYHI